jgi:hypothetical protein
VAAVEALQQAGKSAATWSVSEFSLRSMHPVLRSGIETYLGSNPGLQRPLMAHPGEFTRFSS